mmetsp:Transcript_20951/g.53535  ORF Transcript_20951/g.53535 Transcript_20951/m.53535 type:complete len:282 (-) Transcript_20951:51-896(-)
MCVGSAALELHTSLSAAIHTRMSKCLRQACLAIKPACFVTACRPRHPLAPWAQYLPITCSHPLSACFDSAHLRGPPWATYRDSHGTTDSHVDTSHLAAPLDDSKPRRLPRTAERFFGTSGAPWRPRLLWRSSPPFSPATLAATPRLAPLRAVAFPAPLRGGGPGLQDGLVAAAAGEGERLRVARCGGAQPRLLKDHVRGREQVRVARRPRALALAGAAQHAERCLSAVEKRVAAVAGHARPREDRVAQAVAICPSVGGIVPLGKPLCHGFLALRRGASGVV